MLTLPLLIFIIIILFIAYFYLNATDKPENFPPGPIRLPIWGSYWFLLRENYNHAHLAAEKLRGKYKSDILGLYLGDTPAIVTFSYDLCRELLTRDEFIGRNDTIITRGRGLGELKGIFFTDGPLWREQRRFSLRHLRDFGFGRRSETVENFVLDEIKDLIHFLNKQPSEKDSDVCRAKGEFLMPDLLYAPLINSILLLLVSCRFDNYKLREIGRIALKFQRSSDTTGCAISMTPWLKYIAPDFFGYTTTFATNDCLLEFLKEIIDDHLATFSTDHMRDFTDMFIGLKLNQNENWDYKQLLLTVLDYMFPSAIAIGHSLQFYFAHLINNPHVQRRIQNEIDKIVGNARLPNLDDRKSMPYTEATIREAIRIFPLNPFGIPRRCMEDTTLGGYFIPKDSVMLPCIWTAHRDETVWTNPEEFQPERFLDSCGNLLKKDLTIGFGAGRRLCAGETFARQNMFLIIAGLIQNFTFESIDQRCIDLNKAVPGVNLSLDDMWLRAIPRK